MEDGAFGDHGHHVLSHVREAYNTERGCAMIHLRTSGDVPVPEHSHKIDPVLTGIVLVRRHLEYLECLVLTARPTLNITPLYII